MPVQVAREVAEVLQRNYYDPSISKLTGRVAVHGNEVVVHNLNPLRLRKTLEHMSEVTREWIAVAGKSNKVTFLAEPVDYVDPARSHFAAVRLTFHKLLPMPQKVRKP